MAPRMKRKMTLLDIIYLVQELKPVLEGMFVQNIYDVDSRSFCLKLSRTGQPKLFLNISPAAMWTQENIEFSANALPSGFAIKLRKHIRKRKIMEFSVLGRDRVIKLSFGEFFIIVELYASGNVVLCNSSYNIMSLLRVYKVENTRVAVNQTYPIENIVSELHEPEIGEVRKTYDALENKDICLRDLLSSSTSPYSKYGKDCISHFLLKHGIDTMRKDIADISEKDLHEGLTAAYTCLHPTSVARGYIFYSLSSEGKQFYESFECLKFSQKGECVLEFKTFNEAMAEYFSKISIQKVEKVIDSAKAVAKKKVDKVKNEQQKRVENMLQQATRQKQMAEQILAHSEVVDNCLVVIRSAVENSLDWTELEALVAQHKQGSNEVAKIIHKLNLKNNSISVRIGDQFIDLDIHISAQANANEYFAKSKNSVRKANISEEIGKKLLKEAEEKALTELKVKEVQNSHKINKLTHTRSVYWFEKFFWCVTSSGNLVLGGKDAHQNEILVKRYLRKNDLFLHVDIHGAPTMILRSLGKAPDLTSIREAAHFAVCRSKCWEAKRIAKVYYVFANQVSKTAPSGEYLGVGSFMVRGRKNYVVVNKLEMSFGILFKLDNTQPSFDTRASDWKKDVEEIELDDAVEAGELTIIKANDVKQNKAIREAEEAAQKERVKNVTEKPQEKSERGKKGKMKKIKKKYKDQLPEDKERLMKIIGNVSNLQEESSDNPADNPEAEANKASPKIKSKPVKVTEDLAETEEKHANDDVDIKTFTGTPTDTDVLLFALPVCAPCSSLAAYKYKVKFQPGTTKRGKGLKEITQHLKATKEARDTELALMSLIEENASMQTVLSSIKVSAVRNNRRK